MDKAESQLSRTSRRQSVTHSRMHASAQHPEVQSLNRVILSSLAVSFAVSSSSFLLSLLLPVLTETTTSPTPSAILFIFSIYSLYTTPTDSSKFLIMTLLKMEYKLVVIVVALLWSIESGSGFFVRQQQLSRKTQPSSVFHTSSRWSTAHILRSKLFGPEDGFNKNDDDDDDDDDDDISRINPNGLESAGGEAMAQNFFKELRKREQGQENESSTTTDEKIRSRSAFPGTSESSESSSTPPSESSPLPKKKFTGMQESFYAQQRLSSTSTSSGGQARTPREMMMEREFQLVGRAERGIAVQAVVAVLALVFYIYVGLSGGIVSGLDAQTEDFGGDDEIMPFEQVVPVQRDREASVWL